MARQDGMKEDATMLNMTDRQLYKAGWYWALRDETGELLAVSVCLQDAAKWLHEKRGRVIELMGAREVPKE